MNANPEFASFARLPVSTAHGIHSFARTRDNRRLFNRVSSHLMSARHQSCALPRALDTRNSIIRLITDHGQVINVSCFNLPVAKFRRQKIELISSAARTRSSRRYSDRRCLCTSLPADTGTEAASSSRAFGPGLRTSTQ